eukprot:scaffold274308_cov35-Tisochrysis_lutea.AAC.3
MGRIPGNQRTGSMTGGSKARGHTDHRKPSQRIPKYTRKKTRLRERGRVDFTYAQEKTRPIPAVTSREQRATQLLMLRSGGLHLPEEIARSHVCEATASSFK